MKLKEDFLRTIILLLALLPLRVAGQYLSRADRFRAVMVDPISLQPSPETPIGKSVALEFQSRVRTSLERFSFGITEAISGHRFTAHQFLGYSGALYADIKAFESTFRDSVLERVRSTEQAYGPNAYTVLILGLTVDGFGRGYQIINDLKQKNIISKDKVIVVGMASDASVDYHLEGIQKNWGDVISPYQELFYLKDTFSVEEGKPSWELKDSEFGESDTAKILKDLSRFSNSGSMSFNVFGGGVQAFNETMELILEARGRPQRVDIKLHLGLLPGKPAKDTGYRSADMVAFLLARFPYLLTGNVNLTLKSGKKVYSLNEYKNSKEFKYYLDAYKNADTYIRKLNRMEQTPEIAAQIRFYQALKQIEDLATLEIDKFRHRSSNNLRRLRAVIASPEQLLERPDQYRSAMDMIDSCITCAKDADSLKLENTCGYYIMSQP